jgi:hypothetical protein
MTRILSELLGASEQRFRASLDKLERASGHPNADIQLTSELSRSVKAKLVGLGLDGHDTTGPELYAALQERFKADDQRLMAALRGSSKKDDDMSAVVHTLQNLPLAKSSFALKLSVAKALLKKSLPKKTMKQLGYRSFDSMLKHESVAAIYAAASSLESAAWQKQLTESYKKLRARDFETRAITIAHPTAARWQAVTSAIVHSKRHTVLSFKELGAIVILPLPETAQPPAATTTTLILALHELNEIRAASTFLKLCQVKPDFGSIVQTVAADEPTLNAEILDRPVPWQIVQRYFARFKGTFNASVLEPHIQADDLTWHSVERLLEHIEPSLGFWRGTQHLSVLHEHQPVSLNLVDVALNYCNQLPFAKRVAHTSQLALWHELLLRYLKHENIEQTVLGQLQAELVPEPALT